MELRQYLKVYERGFANGVAILDSGRLDGFIEVSRADWPAHYPTRDAQAERLDLDGMRDAMGGGVLIPPAVLILHAAFVSLPWSSPPEPIPTEQEEAWNDAVYQTMWACAKDQEKADYISGLVALAETRSKALHLVRQWIRKQIST